MPRNSEVSGTALRAPVRAPSGALPGDLSAALAALALAAAVVLLTVVAGRQSREVGAGTESLLLAVWSALVLAPLTWLGIRLPRFAGRTAPMPPPALIAPLAALAVALALTLLPRTGGMRPGYVQLILVLAVVASGVAWGRTVRGGRSGARSRRFALAACAFGAAAIVAYGDRLWTAPAAPSTWLLVALLPALAVAGADRSPLLAAALVLSPLVARERWWMLLTLAALLALAAAPPRSALRRAARAALLAAAALALAGGAFPWMRARPISEPLAALLRPPARELSLGRRAAALTAAAPRLEIAGDGDAIGTLLIDSYLTNSSALPCGTALATVDLEQGGKRIRGTLVVGSGSAEWAADRPGVAEALHCAPPPPFVRWITTAGRFLGRTTRATFELESPLVAERIVIERDAALPPELTLAIFHLAAER